MTIIVTIGNTNHSGEVPFHGCGYVAVPGADCPICSQLSALMKGSRILALAGAGTEGMRRAQAEYPGAHIIASPPSGALRVRLPRLTAGHDRYTGDAECARCRSIVGPMVVQLSTLFGLEEDEAVLKGRARVY